MNLFVLGIWTNFEPVRRFSSIGVLYFFCACCCIGYSILFQMTDDMRLNESELTAYHAHDSILEVIIDLMLPNENSADEEINDINESVEFLFSRTVIYQIAFTTDNSKNKVVVPPDHFSQPLLEITTPPPWIHS